MAALGNTIYLSAAGNFKNDWNEYEKSKHPQKGQELRGGKKTDRDNWYGYNNKESQNWWHRIGKQRYGGADINPAEDARIIIYSDRAAEGRPKVK